MRPMPPGESTLGRHGPRRFSVHVLGHFRLLKMDRPIDIPPRLRKPLELLQALIAFGGMEVSAGALIDALWPDAEGDAAYHALESALYRLRQLLGARDAVRMAGRKVSLDRDQFWVDMWEFEQELRLSRGAQTDALARIGRIRQLYKGHFLEHASDRPWALKTRHSMRDRFVWAVRDTAGDCESQGRWQDAAHLYQSALELDSLNEDLYRGLMLCHQEMGDHSEALQAYRRCRELLARVLGVSPSARTQALYHNVRERAVYADGLADADAR
jgi:LuxR family maltose regulon positive regulatory protein